MPPRSAKSTIDDAGLTPTGPPMMGTPRKGEVVIKFGATGGVVPPHRRGKERGVRAVGAEEGAGVQEPWDPTVLEGSLHERGEREPACAIDVAAVPTGLVWRESGRRHVRFRQGARLPAGVIRSLMVSRSGCRKLHSRRRAERAAGCWM